MFNDTKNYFDPNQPTHGVYIANAGVKIKVRQGLAASWPRSSSAR